MGHLIQTINRGWKPLKQSCALEKRAYGTRRVSATMNVRGTMNCANTRAVLGGYGDPGNAISAFIPLIWSYNGW